VEDGGVVIVSHMTPLSLSLIVVVAWWQGWKVDPGARKRMEGRSRREEEDGRGM
jgi:hypothetical protein